MSAFQYDDSTKTGAKSEKWKSAHVCIIAMIIHPSMKWGEQRKTLLLTKLLYNFTLKKNYLRHSAASDDANIWVFSQGHPGQGRWHMWNGKQPFLDSPGMCTGDFLISDLGSVQRKKGRVLSLGKKKKMQPTSGHAFQSIQVFTASPPGSFLQDPSPPRSSV